MAYTQPSSNESNTLPWIIGGVALFYLWYEGYLAQWLGGSQASVTPATSVDSAATTPTVNQVASSLPSNPSVTDLANESYYTWLASGAPLTTLEQIDAAAQVVENNYVAANSSPTSVASGGTTPTVIQASTPSTPSTPSIAAAASSSGWAWNLPVAAGLATLANGILTYTSGISYRVNPDGTMTFLTPSTQVQNENAAHAASVSSSNPTPVTSVASGSTPVRSNPGYRTANATPPIVTTGRLPTTTMARTSASTGNPNPATSVTSANPPRR
jgi:hypothetical protein